MQGRSSIHYGVFLVAGLLITSIALFTVTYGNTENPAAMQLFAGIGGLFILIGFAKWLSKRLSNLRRAEKDLENRIAGGNLTEKKIIACNCGARNYSTSNFCHMCGEKI